MLASLDVWNSLRSVLSCAGHFETPQDETSRAIPPTVASTGGHLGRATTTQRSTQNASIFHVENQRGWEKLKDIKAAGDNTLAIFAKHANPMIASGIRRVVRKEQLTRNNSEQENLLSFIRHNNGVELDQGFERSCSELINLLEACAKRESATNSMQ